MYNIAWGGKKMKVFISWSGNTSLKIAQIFREWLPSVIQSIEPYVSSEDIDKGARWSTDIAKELEDSTFGILCVTKDNIEAPWLSFEAGALSKTMEKSFVTPFLFDIKRSEVQGPILQFQSTVFEKDDIKKMVKTLNKACDEAGISDARLDKSFDVWYPTLEESLNELKKVSSHKGIDEGKGAEEISRSSEILEEILELSRDNQKLLRSPDTKLYDDIEKIKESIEENFKRNIMLYEQNRTRRKYSSMFIEEVMHMNRIESSYRFLMVLSLVKDDFPWIYDMGKELNDILKGENNYKDKSLAISEFKEMIEFTWSNPMMREIYGRNKDTLMLMKELPYALTRYLDDMLDSSNNESSNFITH